MPNLLSARVSFFRGSTTPIPVTDVTVVWVLNRIRDGDYRRQIERLRTLLREGRQAAYDRSKRTLDAVTFGGTFSPTRAKAHLIQHSGIVHGDLDHLDDVEAVKARLAADPHIVYTFTSPSGTGLKVGVCIDPATNDAAYKHAWQVMANAHQQAYGLTWDRSGKDVCRLCYVSWDPTLYRNGDTLPFPVPEPAPYPAPRPTLPPTAFDVPRNRRERYTQQAIQTAVAMIDASTPGNRHHHRLKASELLGGYIGGGLLGYDEAWGALAHAVARNTDDLDRAMKTIANGLRHGQERPITLEELEAERQAWLTVQGYFYRHTSPSIVPSSAPGAPNGGAPYRPYRGYRGYHAYRGYGREVPHGHG
jgi:hypothetical protein